MKNESLDKVKYVAKQYTNPEKGNASRILAKNGIFVDIAGIEWTRDELQKFIEKKRKYLFGFDPLTI